jgi:hypothetical protein
MTQEPKSMQPLDPDAGRIGELLRRDRPSPPASFRGALGRHLRALDPGWGPRPERLIQAVGAYVAVGLLLIGLGALVGLGVL